jgi:hypothetical protein
MMDNLKKDLLDVIKIIERTVGKLSEEQLYNILNGRGILVYAENKLKRTHEKVEKRKFDDVIFEINKINSREKAFELIENLKLKKEDLFNLGKLVNASISKKDRKDIIIERIIEATVGVRLRDEAIIAIDIGEGDRFTEIK